MPGAKKTGERTKERSECHKSALPDPRCSGDALLARTQKGWPTQRRAWRGATFRQSTKTPSAAPSCSTVATREPQARRGRARAGRRKRKRRSAGDRRQADTATGRAQTQGPVARKGVRPRHTGSGRAAHAPCRNNHTREATAKRRIRPFASAAAGTPAQFPASLSPPSWPTAWERQCRDQPRARPAGGRSKGPGRLNRWGGGSGNGAHLRGTPGGKNVRVDRIPVRDARNAVGQQPLDLQIGLSVACRARTRRSPERGPHSAGRARTKRHYLNITILQRTVNLYYQFDGVVHKTAHRLDEGIVPEAGKRSKPHWPLEASPTFRERKLTKGSCTAFCHARKPWPG